MSWRKSHNSWSESYLIVTAHPGYEECERKCTAMDNCFTSKYDETSDSCSFISKHGVYIPFIASKYYKYFAFFIILKLIYKNKSTTEYHIHF